VIAAVRELDELEGAEPAAVDAFLARHPFPLTDGTRAVFVWRGEADEVVLRHGVFGLPAAQPFARLAGTDLWTCTLEIPRGSRVEYKIEVVARGEGRLVLDPLNPHEARDPFGTNSVYQAPGYETPDWALPDPEARPGELTEHVVESAAFGGRRTVRLYLPARFRRTRHYPLLIAHDGDDYLRFSGLKTVLDNLIARLEVAPLVVAFTMSPDRLREYAADRRHARFVAEELVPHLEGSFPVGGGPADRGLLGASFGAVASLSTAWRYPGRFGRLLLQSGSFAFSDIGRHHRTAVFDPVAEFVNAFREDPGRPAEKVYVSCGTYESLIYENRSLVPRLQATGMEVKFTEARDGHNWENWRDRMREGLSWLFPGPLWMVYE
jgi:enterochelin esterase family protein